MAFRVGPVNNITRVQWNGQKGTVTLEYATSQRLKKKPPTIELVKVPWTTKTFNLGDDEPLSIVDPNDPTKKKLLLRKPKPFKIVQEGDAAMRGIVFFYLESIGRFCTRDVPSDPKSPRVFKFQLAMPGTGGSHLELETTYYLWGSDFGATSLEENLAHPFTTGDPFSPFPNNDPRSLMTLPRPFGTAGERNAYLALNVATWHGDQTNEQVTVSDGGDWNAFVTSYSYKLRHEPDFPINKQDVPQWDTSKNSGYSQQTKVPTYGATSETVVPAMVVEFKVDLTTLKITSKKV